MKLKVLLVVVGVVQLVLGAAYLFVPHALLHWMGHSLPAPDINYPFGMLAARFVAYGLGLFVVARDPVRHEFWIRNMVLIQAIDLGVGVYYTLAGTVSLQRSAFPMFNATLIAVLLWLWRPRLAHAATTAA